MVNAIGTIDPWGWNKPQGYKYDIGPRVRQEAPEENRRIYCPKRFEYKNKEEDKVRKFLMTKIKRGYYHFWLQTKFKPL